MLCEKKKGAIQEIRTLLGRMRKRQLLFSRDGKVTEVP